MAYDTDLLNIFIYAFFVLAGISALLAVTAVAWLVATRPSASTGAAWATRRYGRRADTAQTA